MAPEADVTWGERVCASPDLTKCLLLSCPVVASQTVYLVVAVSFQPYDLKQQGYIERQKTPIWTICKIRNNMGRSFGFGVNHHNIVGSQFLQPQLQQQQLEFQEEQQHQYCDEEILAS
ncbi:hypothetical protein Syun_019679 [Stephania yunnanensis]|uniref:Uncharacterized protein n=1 Tax=Stephania yunnanensis TaxID=152371 RepID=A0AAP0NW35_9MAGN